MVLAMHTRNALARKNHASARMLLDATKVALTMSFAVNPAIPGISLCHHLGGRVGGGRHGARRGVELITSFELVCEIYLHAARSGFAESTVGDLQPVLRFCLGRVSERYVLVQTHELGARQPQAHPPECCRHCGGVPPAAQG